MATQLPFLPGLSTNPQLGKTRFNKPQGLVFENNVPVLVDTASKRATNGSAYPAPADGTAQPAWLAFDRKVLNFNASFREGVVERRDEQSRVRVCKVYFYLEDDTMQVVEPITDNSGLPQGTLIRRHRIPKPAPNDDKFYTVHDVNVGNELVLYGRVFTLNGCDDFTRSFLTNLGVRVGESFAAPVDPYSATRKALSESMQPCKPFEKHDTLGQFLANDRKVLRFYCVWDDTESAFGDRRYLVLHYFLADDTISLHEVLEANSGRDSGAAFLRRSKLPKEAGGVVKQPGQITPRTILNVFGPSLSGRYILDNLRTGSLSDKYYLDSDLTIGTVIDVYGRRVLICDCDNFTREYYTLKYGVTEFAPLQLRDDAGQPIKTELPPYDGCFGSEDDSLQSCLSLIPQPPRPQPGRHLPQDTGLERTQLRFVATMDSALPTDTSRQFIITYYLVDDTVAVFEQRQRNSGIMGGKFLERRKQKTIDGTRNLDAHDFVVGERVMLGGHKFVLVDADEFAYRFMYDHNFPESSPPAIIAKAKASAPQALAEAVSQVNAASSGDYILAEAFQSIVEKVLGSVLNKQNIHSLMRAFSNADVGEGEAALELLVQQLQSVLAKKNYDNFVNLNKAFLYYDKDRKGVLSKDQIKQICFEYNLPIADSLLDAVIAQLPTNAHGLIDYAAFAQCLHYTTTPAIPKSNSFTSHATGNLGASVRSAVVTARLPVQNSINARRFSEALSQ